MLIPGAMLNRMEGDELLTVDKAAERLKVSHMTVRRYMDKGLLPKRKLGREYVLYLSDLKKLKRPRNGRPRLRRCAEPDRR
jgi:excisionase family DNA binding protein